MILLSAVDVGGTVSTLGIVAGFVVPVLVVLFVAYVVNVTLLGVL